MTYASNYFLQKDFVSVDLRKINYNAHIHDNEGTCRSLMCFLKSF